MSVCEVCRASTGEVLGQFEVAGVVVGADGANSGEPANVGTATRERQRRMARDVDHITWSPHGAHVAAAAGRDAVVASVATVASVAQGAGGTAGVAVESVISSSTGTVYELSFAGGGVDSDAAPAAAAGAGDETATGGGGGTAAVEGAAAACGGGTAANVAAAADGADGHSTPAPALDFAPPTTSLAVGSYGGVAWLPTTPHTRVADARPRFEIGSTAVLSVAVTFDGALLAVGCMDRRVRVFRVARGGEGGGWGDGGGGDGGGGAGGGGAGGWAGAGAAAGASGTAEAAATGTATDWVGFDGPVTVVAWSQPSSSGGGPSGEHHSEWLASAGGSNLMVAPRRLPRGDAPVLCVAPGAEGGGAGRPRWARVAWAPGQRGPTTERLLAAMEAQSGLTHIFDVTAGDGAVPRRASPLATIVPPGGQPVAGLAVAGLGGKVGEAEAGRFHEQLMKLAFVWGDGEVLVLAASWGSCVAACRVERL